MLLTVWTMWRQRTVYYLIVGVKISSTLLVYVSDIDISSGVVAIHSTSTKALTNSASCDVSVALRVLRASRNGHLLALSVSGTLRLFHLLVVLILLQVAVSLRMWEVLLIWIGLETATHLILRLSIETVLNVDSLVVAAVGMVHFLNALRWRGEGVRIDLRIVSASVGSLDHIESSIGLIS